MNFKNNKLKYRSLKLENLVFGSLMIGLIITFKFIQILTPFIPIFGVSIFPELFLIPVAICAIFCSFKISLIVAFVGVLFNIIIPGTGAAVIPAAFPFDFAFPYFIFLIPGLINLKWFKNRKHNFFIWLNLFILVSNLIVTLSHTISGVLFFSHGANGSSAESFHMNPWTYSIIINSFYGLFTLFCSVIILNTLCSIIIVREKHEYTSFKIK